MQSGYFKSGSASIYYELHGEGEEILVLLHGNGGNCKNFKNQIPFFSKKYKILAIDSRGHEESGFGENAISLGAMALDLENLCDYLGYKKINLLGFSDGANIAMMFAIKNPDMVDKLILVGGNIKFSGLTFTTGLMIMLGYLSSCILSKIDKKLTANKEMFALMVKEPNLKPSMLSIIKSKTLVINGNKDMIKISHAKLITKNIPNAELKIVNGDHFYLFKSPDEFNSLVMEFLQK